MSKPVLIIPVALVVILLAVAGGVYAYDGARPAHLAPGITIAGLDVGGLTVGEAKARLEDRWARRFKRPIVVHHAKQSWRLRAREAGIRTDLAEVVSRAMVRSEKGGAIDRTLRRLQGGNVDAHFEPSVTHSAPAVSRLVARVRRGVERPSTSARVTITPAGITTKPSRRGLRVKASALRKVIDSALASPTASRRFVARTRKLRPEVTEADLIKRNSVVLIADRSTFQLKVFKRLELARTYPIAVGQAGNDTPGGEYIIANKAVNPAWSVPNSDWAGDLAGKLIPGGVPENPIKARWLGIVDGVGIHGTSDRGSIGFNASHGCLRMLEEDVIELYPQVPVGAKILIV